MSESISIRRRGARTLSGKHFLARSGWVTCPSGTIAFYRSISSRYRWFYFHHVMLHVVGPDVQVVQSLCLFKTLVQLVYWLIGLFHSFTASGVECVYLWVTDDAGVLQATRSLMYSYDDLNTGSFFAGPVGNQTFIDSSLFFSTSHTD